MAIFGLQIVISVAVFCFLTKLTKYYSFGRWLLCTGLFHYWPPTNEEFKTAIKQRYAKESSSKSKKQSNVTKSFQKHGSANKDASNSVEEFPIPIDTSIELKLIPLIYRDAIQVKYVDDFFASVDFICGSVVIFVLTEIYLYVIPMIRQNNEHLNEINLSLFWSLIALLFGLSILTKFVREYLKVDEGILCIVFGAFSFLLALCLQYADEKFFDFNLKQAYGNRTIVNNDEDDGKNYLDRRFIYIVMAVSIINAYQSVILFFPAFRFGHLQYLFIIKDNKKNFKQIATFALTIINFILPIFICLLWFKPIVGHLSAELVLNLKLISIIICVVLRLALFRPYTQIYLGTAFERVRTLYQQQQSSTGRVTNLTYQRNVTSIFFYLGVVASQYILPAFIELFLCFYLKFFAFSQSITENQSKLPPKWLKTFDEFMDTKDPNSSIVLTWNEFRSIFHHQNNALLVSYVIFWHHAVFCFVSCASLIYNTYMQREQRTHVKHD